ncbi:hypothetical protein VTN00DRAFT_3639 [Thermoascus crustaceus]|uniref:uncharacterized protein n=1 Tax=Thermoascus crustaceus TaxID=5088 RepID=UPI003743AEB5
MRLIAVPSFVRRALGDRQGFEQSVDKGSVSSGVDRDQLPGEARHDRRESWARKVSRQDALQGSQREEDITNGRGTGAQFLTTMPGTRTGTLVEGGRRGRAAGHHVRQRRQWLLSRRSVATAVVCRICFSKISQLTVVYAAATRSTMPSSRTTAIPGPSPYPGLLGRDITGALGPPRSANRLHETRLSLRRPSRGPVSTRRGGPATVLLPQSNAGYVVRAPSLAQRPSLPRHAARGIPSIPCGSMRHGPLIIAISAYENQKPK